MGKRGKEKIIHHLEDSRVARLASEGLIPRFGITFTSHHFRDARSLRCTRFVRIFL